jgi:hypothetical protein
VTFDASESVPEDILSALKADGQVAAPAGARGRVLSRLGVGVAAGAAVVLPSSVSAAMGNATGTSMAPVAGSAIGFAKTLVAHPILSVFATLAIGSSVGLVAYTALEPSPAPSPVVANVEVVQRSAPLPAEARTVPSVEPTVEPTGVPPAQRAARAAARPPVPAAAPATDEHTAAPTVEPSPPTPSAPTAQDPEPALVPAPDLPSSRGARLAEQQALLDQARASLQRGDGAGALAIVTGHERLHPVTAFAEERDAIGILALVMVGRADDAWMRAEAFAKRHPTSLFLPSIQRSLRPPDITPGKPKPPK